MAEAQNIAINLDEASIEILRGVDKIHRDSLINVGLALVKKTTYYKTLAGTADAVDLDDVASLDINTDDTTSKTSKSLKEAEENKPTKPKSSWDNF